ncbi:MAG: polysaccharide deacetylase family protein [Aestuariivirga sp.]
MLNPKVLALQTGLKVLHGSGLTSLLRKRLQGAGSIFCLHQVCPGGGMEQGFAPNSKLEITPAFLRELITLVRSRGFETLSLGTMVERLKQGRGTGKPMAVFTLDDGYKDNFVHAMPVFEELNCPYTVFIAPAITDGTCNLWWRTLEQIIAGSDHLKFSSADKQFDLPCRTVKQKLKAFDELFLFYARMDEHSQRTNIDKLAVSFGIDPQAYCRNVAMDWAQVRDMAKSALCTIGAHTINHFLLKTLSAEEALSEMRDSKLRIEKELGRDIEFFAYPYGDRRAAGLREYELAKKAGFTASVTTRKGVIWPEDIAHLQSLPRVMVSGRYQERSFVDALISGVPTALLNKIRPIHAD